MLNELRIKLFKKIQIPFPKVNYDEINDIILNEILNDQKYTIVEIMNKLNSINLINQNLSSLDRFENREREYPLEDYIYEEYEISQLEKRHKEVLEHYKIDDSRRKIRKDYNNLFNYLPVMCINQEHLSSPLEHKMCHFAHNEDEINFHVLKYKIKYCPEKPQCQKNHLCQYSHNVHVDLRRFFKYFNEDIMDLQKEFFQYKILKDNIEKLKMSETPPYEFELSTYRVFKCPYGINCQEKKKNCLNYHEKTQKRRDPRLYLIYFNEACKYALNKREWNDPRDLCPFVI